jgi:uncharacterized SAM-binding protein YcdF (DUF218 family)
VRRRVLVVTSQYHVPRAAACAAVVFGSHGIIFEMVPSDEFLPARARAEGRCRRWRDVLRCFVWVVTGWDGQGVAKLVHPDRD